MIDIFKKTVTIMLMIAIYGSANAQESRVVSSFNGFHCDGKHGICSIDNSSYRNIANTFLTWNENKTLTMNIKKSMLSRQEVYNIFEITKEKIIHTKDYTFKVPHTITFQSLGLSEFCPTKKYNAISKGDYRIHIKDDVYSITFNIE